MMKPLKLATALTAGLLLNALPAAVLAQNNAYSVSTRSVFLSGCLLEEPPDFQDTNEVVQKMRLCVCLLDKFQARYSEGDFQRLFQPAKAEELNNFVREKFPACL